MKQFLKFMIASSIGLVIGVFSIAIIIGLVVSSGDSKEVKLDEAHILHLELKGSIEDRVENMPLDLGKFSGENNTSLGLNHILANIKKAESDPNIKGIFLDMGFINCGFATLEEIRNALIEFKKSGKIITSYSEIYTQRAYYIASVADSIFIYPEGALELTGLNNTVVFYTNALEKLGIEPQIIRHGEFKSAVEPFMNTKMSDASRKQVKAYMSSIWQHYLEKVATDREIPKEELSKIVENLKIRTPKDALELGLVDHVFYKDQLQNYFTQWMEVESYKDVKFMSHRKYIDIQNEDLTEKFKKEKIAIIYAQGEIMSGEGNETVIGSERISKALRKARKDDEIKAIVLRINSPGGSALASDVIWREMKLAQMEKPLVVSMGDVAASGAYYIACTADKIYASPNTLTGSIGVFGILMNFKELLTDKLGLTFDQVKTNKFADIGYPNRAMTKEEYNIIHESVVKIYDDFVSKVAEGRNLSVAEVDAIGQGRVWSGVNAQNINLIDQYGGLEDAIKGAAELAEIDDYRTIDMPEPIDPFQKLIGEFEESVKSSWVKHQLGEQYIYYKTLEELKDLKGIQARMPYQFIMD